MSITITITDPTPEQIAALFGGTNTANTSVDKAPAKDKPKADKPKSEDKPKEEAKSDGPTKEDVTKAAQKYAGANSRDALKELLTSFKAENISGLEESDYAAFIEKCNG